MAIKGKSRRRSRAKGVHTPPRPAITPKKVPFLARRDVRHALAVVLGVLVMLGGLRVWQNDVRAGALRGYEKALKKATSLTDIHLGAAGETAIDQQVRDFTSAKVAVAAFLSLTETWEKDFNAAKDAVAKLTPPEQVRAAEDWFVEGLSAFAGAARLYNVAAQQRRFADEPAQKKIQQKLEDQVQVVLQHAGEALTRARSVYQRGMDVLQSYLMSWHVSEAVPAGTFGG